MGYQVKKAGYFKTGVEREELREQHKEQYREQGKEQHREQHKEPSKEQQKEMREAGTEKAGRAKISREMAAILQKTKQVLTAADLSVLQKELRRIEQDINKNVFSIAVVGEFSKGKSTFLNKLLGREILPVGNLPTTAMLTRIRHHSKEMLVVFDKEGRHKQKLPLSVDSWEGLVADNFGENGPEGTVLAGIHEPWLGKNGIELIDTPGAGDLEEAREQVIGDALLGCDGVVIAVSASAVLSKSEQLFIEERIIARKTPFLMLVITKMDQIPVSERAEIIRYTKNRLSKWNVAIPVYVPYDVEMPDDFNRDRIGMDKVKAEMEEWVAAPERARLAEEWFAARLLSVIETAVSVLREQEAVRNLANEKEREKLVAKKKEKLSDAQVIWEELRLQMMERSTQCYNLFWEKTEEYTATITERLQYEASHTGSPEKWWKEDYPYRLKVELTNMAVGINRVVMKKINDDTRWFNASMDKNFKTHVLCQYETIFDKKDVKEFSAGNASLDFEDIQKERNAVRVGTAAATVAGFILFATTGLGAPIIATTGISTGSSILSEKIFKEKIEKQRETVREAVGKGVPVLVQNATQESEQRLKAVYDDVIGEAVKQEKAWLEAQRAAIEQTTKVKGCEKKGQIGNQIALLEQLKEKLQRALL